MIDFGGQEIKGHSRSCKAEGGFKRLTEASFSTALGLVVFSTVSRTYYRSIVFINAETVYVQH